MTHSEFVYWLNGYVEICGARPDDQQWEIIKDHLLLVFSKVTPNRSSPTYCAPSASIGSHSLPFRSRSDRIVHEVPLNPDGTPKRIDHTC